MDVPLSVSGKPRKTDALTCLQELKRTGKMSVVVDGFKYTYVPENQLLQVLVHEGNCGIAYNVITGGKDAAGRLVDHKDMFTIFRHDIEEKPDFQVFGSNRVGYIEPSLPPKAMFSTFVKAIHADVLKQMSLFRSQPWISYFSDEHEVDASAEPVPDSAKATDLAGAFERVRAAILRGSGFKEVKINGLVLETLAEAGGHQLLVLVHSGTGTYHGCAHARILELMNKDAELQVMINDHHPWLDVPVPRTVSQAGLLKLILGFVASKFAKSGTAHAAAEPESSPAVFEKCQDFRSCLAKAGTIRHRGFTIASKLDDSIRVSRGEQYLDYCIAPMSSTDLRFSVYRIRKDSVYGALRFQLGHFLPELPLKRALSNMLKLILPDAEKQFHTYDRGLGYTTDVQAAAEPEPQQSLDPDTVRNILLKQSWIHGISLYAFKVLDSSDAVFIHVTGALDHKDMAVVSVSVCDTIVFLRAGITKTELATALGVAQACARVCEKSRADKEPWASVWDKVKKFREKYVRGGLRPLGSGVFNRAQDAWRANS